MRKRALFLVAAPILALVFVAALLASVRSTVQPPAVLLDDNRAASATAIPALPASVDPIKPTAPVTAAAPPPALTSARAPAADAGIVALVNGTAVYSDRLALVQSVDQVMSTLLGTERGTPAALLDQLINGTLVMQQMALVEGSTAAPGAEAAARLQALLGAAGKTEEDLTRTLSAAAVERGVFDQYFAEVLAVDGFARQAAASDGIDLDAYIAGLQSAARISYGPAGVLSISASQTQTQTQTSTSTASAPASSPIAGTPQSALDTGPPVADSGAAVRGVAAGQIAPDFTLDTLGEDGQTAFDDLLGRPTVLSFWTTWCPYCLRQTPVLVAAAERFAGDVRFVGIDVAEEPGVVAAYVVEHAIPYTVLLDRQSQAATAYAVNGFPTTYFLDATGHIVAQHIGSLSEEELTQYVEQLRRGRS